MDDALVFCLNSFYESTNICCFCYTEEGEAVFSSNQKIRVNIKASIPFEALDLAETDMPHIIEIDNDVYMWYIRTESKACFFFGPLRGISADQNTMEFHLRQKGWSGLPQVPEMGYNQLAANIQLSCYLVTGKKYSKEWIMDHNLWVNIEDPRKDVEYHIGKYEDEKIHQSYEVEQKWLEMIERGELTEENRDALGGDMSQIGIFSNNSELKQLEYCALITIILSSRAAMRGGASPAICYEKTEVMLQQLSNCRKTTEIIDIMRPAAFYFSRLVRESKAQNGNNLIVSRCKEYMMNNLFRKFTIQDMARDMGISRSYLSTTFSKVEGISPSAYLTELRLQESTKLLSFSDKSISEIADYLQFSSASRFAASFHKRFQTTPQKYRNSVLKQNI